MQETQQRESQAFAGTRPAAQPVAVKFRAETCLSSHTLQDWDTAPEGLRMAQVKQTPCISLRLMTKNKQHMESKEVVSKLVGFVTALVAALASAKTYHRPTIPLREWGN